LFIRSIRKYGAFYGDTLKVECPTHSGNWMTLREVADELTTRVISLFSTDEAGKRRYNDTYSWFYEKPENKDLLLFFEYFHGDNGKGLGASHQTGWTAVVADLIHQMEKDKPQKPKKQLAVIDEEDNEME
ncbi:MAG: glucosidase, partial [Chitinophagaceae bacterium]